MSSKRLFFKVAKILITVLSLAAVFYYGKIDFDLLGKKLSTINLGYYIGSLFTVILVIIYVTKRWQVLLSSNEGTVSYKRLVHINFIGCFFNLFMPSSFGGDLVRAVYLKKTNVSWKQSTSSVFLDRFIGLLSLFLLAFVSLLIRVLTEEADNSTMFIYLIAGTSFMLIGLVLLMNLHSIIRKIIYSRSELVQKYLTKYERFSTSINILNYSRRVIVKGFIISVVGNILSIMAVYLITLALGLNIGVLPILTVFPLVTVVSMIPVSVGGIGVREGAFVFFFAAYSVSADDAVAISVMYFSTIVFLGIIGGIIFSFSKYSLEEVNPKY